MSGMRSGPRNPFLADSGNAMAHGRCDQQDNTPGPGPEGPTEVLGQATSSTRLWDRGTSAG